MVAFIFEVHLLSYFLAEQKLKLKRVLTTKCDTKRFLFFVYVVHLFELELNNEKKRNDLQVLR